MTTSDDTTTPDLPMLPMLQADDEGPWVFVGLDGEMSSADIATGGKLIQAGFAAWTGTPGADIAMFSSLVRQTNMEWASQAAAVHNIPRQAVESAPPADEVDEAAYTWLVAHGAVEGRRLVVPVGLNVASFDMPFFRQALPRTSSLISRRAVDINALCFSFAGWDPNPASGSARDFAGWKRSMKKAVNADLARRGFDVADLDARLDEADSLRATLGDGLLDRLASVPRPTIEQVVEALGVARHPNPKKWFGAKHPVLGRTPLDALVDGDTQAVLAVARSVGS